MRNNPERVLFIDFLRVVAILMVLFSHVLITIGVPTDHWVNPSFGNDLFYWKSWGEIGVTLFLIISGYSLEFSYGHRRFEFGPFFLKRFVRIYPIYYMSLVLAFGIHLFFASWSYFYHGKPFLLLPHFGAQDFFLALGGVNAFWGKWGGPLVWSSWFIGLIMVLYLLYPLISYGIKKFPWRGIIGLLLISIISRQLMDQTKILSGNPVDWFPLSRIFEFGLGVFLYHALKFEKMIGLNKMFIKIPFLTTLSALSFPLFLIHDPLRRFIVFGSMEEPFSLMIGISVFLFLSFGFSKMALSLNQKFLEYLNLKFSRSYFS